MSQRSVRFLWAVALLAFLGVALVLGFVVSLASGETALYERNFVWLFWINAVVALALLRRAGGRHDPPGPALAQRQVRQPAAAQARGHLRAGGRGAGRADLHGVAAVRHPQHRRLVRHQGRPRARRRPEPGQGHARRAVGRPGGEGAQRRHAPRRSARARRRARARAHARPDRRAGSRAGGRHRPDRAGRQLAAVAAARSPVGAR